MQLKLSPSATAELRSQFNALQLRLFDIMDIREELDLEEEEIQGELEAIEKLVPAEESTNPDTPIKSVDTSMAISKSKGFRDNVRAALKQVGGYAKPADVREALDSAGIQNPGETPYNTRVSNELSKLAGMKSSPVQKRDKKYIWVQEESKD